MKIIPAVLTYTENEFIEQMSNLLLYYRHFQIDIADSIYVPNWTLQIEEIGKCLSKLNKTNLNKATFDFHLMVKDFHEEIKKIRKLSSYITIDTILIHDSFMRNYELLIRNYKFSFGVVLNPEVPVGILSDNYNLHKIPIIQIMTINPGFQGAPFIKKMLNKIEQLRLLNYRNKIYIDGGINDSTLPTILTQTYKPDALCIGSFLTKAESMKERVAYLNTLLKKGRVL